jgi:hypothetical protein
MFGLGTTKNSNEWVNWIDEAIYKKHIKYYEYEYFRNFTEIGSGSFGKVYRASYKNPHRYFALKYFSNDNNAVKEIVHEVIMNNTYFTIFIILLIVFRTKLVSPN